MPIFQIHESYILENFDAGARVLNQFWFSLVAILGIDHRFLFKNNILKLRYIG